MKAAHDSLESAESESWVPACAGMLPEDCRTVIAWDSDSAMPCIAFHDGEELCWHAQADGARFADGAVTHWRYYVGPSGKSSAGIPP